jgi:ABC-2 type transport system ATP-binding protein
VTAEAVVTEGLQKVFHGGLIAVDHLDLTIHRGEVFGLLGPNGSGKTTTIRMLCDVERESELIRTKIGYMSQRYGLYDDLTVYENLRFYATVYGLHGRLRAERLEKHMDEIGLSPLRTQLAGTLSGGWKQRLALACATAHEPEMLFLDEPTAGVDPAARRAFWKSIYELAAHGTTILVTTHYMDEAERCQRLAFLSRGHLIGLGTVQEILAQFKQPTIEDVFIELQRRDEGAAA